MNRVFVGNMRPKLNRNKELRLITTSSNPMSRISNSILPASRRVPFQLKSAGRFRQCSRSVCVATPQLSRAVTTLGLGFFGTLFFVPLAVLHDAEQKFPGHVDSILPPQMTSVVGQITSFYDFSSGATSSKKTGFGVPATIGSE